MPDYTKGFEEWWAVYPNRRKKGKGDAFKSWEKNKLESRSSDLTLILARQIEYDEQFRQYTPMPATYLNQARYDDYVPRPPKMGVPEVKHPEYDEVIETDPYRKSVKRVAMYWLWRRMKAIPEDRMPVFIGLVRSLADDARELHEAGKLTDAYAQTIRDTLNEFAAR